MPHEVKMPQLGMTQDSGIIVSWLKAAGDAVSEGDALFEVETDKATMEVEAQMGGWLAGVRAGDGDDVPVGDVIALIVESEAEVAAHASATPAAKPESTPDPTPEPQSEAPPAPKPAPTSAPRVAPIGTAAGTPSPVDKVLASPKAKRIAREQGIDLAALRAQGVPEPIHAADLSRASMGGQSLLTAKVAGGALNALLDQSDGNQRSALFAAFAAGAWRALFDTQDVSVALRELDGTTSVFGGADERAALTLVDLCDTKLTGYVPACGGITLTAARGGDADYSLTLSFPEGSLSLPFAAALLADIAARVENPIRQLL